MSISDDDSLFGDDDQLYGVEDDEIDYYAILNVPRDVCLLVNYMTFTIVLRFILGDGR